MNESIYELLCHHYPSDKYVLMAEVRNKAGNDASSSADYIAVSTWPSRGLTITGIELKRSRTDWLREKKDHGKAENIFRLCDYFWLLTAESAVGDIAKLEEIPETWGWMAVKGSKILTKKEAPRLSPQPIDRDFMVTMLKRASDKTQYVHRDAIETRIKEAHEHGKSETAYSLKNIQQKLESVRKGVSAFEVAAGIRLDIDYGPTQQVEKMGAAVKFIMAGGVEQIKKDLASLETRAKSICERISEGLNL